MPWRGSRTLAGVRRFYYAGDSLGGQLALELALRHPDRVIAVSIICSSARVGQPEAWLERAAMVRLQGTPVLVGPSAGRWYAPGFIETAAGAGRGHAARTLGHG